MVGMFFFLSAQIEISVHYPNEQHCGLGGGLTDGLSFGVERKLSKEGRFYEVTRLKISTWIPKLN